MVQIYKATGRRLEAIDLYEKILGKTAVKLIIFKLSKTNLIIDIENKLQKSEENHQTVLILENLSGLFSELGETQKALKIQETVIG
jgi:hypothetical protein